MGECLVDEQIGPFHIEGPLKAPGDVHPCFVVRHDKIGVVAAFYAPGGDEDAAEDRARGFICGALGIPGY